MTIVSGTTLRIFAIVLREQEAGRVPPTGREIAKECGVSVYLVQQCLYRLRKLGFVTWEERRHRTIRAVMRFYAA